MIYLLLVDGKWFYCVNKVVELWNLEELEKVLNLVGSWLEEYFFY